MQLTQIRYESFWQTLPTYQRELWLLSVELWQSEVQNEIRDPEVDYGFVVFPAAKAYEGFLKDALYHMGLITKEQYKHEHFRIGSALNPDLPIRYRDENWVQEGLVRILGKEVVGLLWEAWKQGRNQVFHYDVGVEGSLPLHEAAEKLHLMAEATKAVIESDAYRRGK